MVSASASDVSRWCIVTADERDSSWAAGPDGIVPIQYRPLDTPVPLLQRALQRATCVAPGSQVLITALDEFRQFWGPLSWFVKPAHHFVCPDRDNLSLASAAAVLSIAEHSPSAMVTLMPARCYVAHEGIFRRALEQALEALPTSRLGVITLGMRDVEQDIDEDFLIAGHAPQEEGFIVDAFVRRPVPWVAANLKRRGALVASGVLVGYAGAFAAHISKMWPGVSRQLLPLISAAGTASGECEITWKRPKGVPRAPLHPLTWRPPALAQHVLPVWRCGWCGLKSPQAVARLLEFYQPRQFRFAPA